MPSSNQSRMSQGSDGSLMGLGYQSTPQTDLNDTKETKKLHHSSEKLHPSSEKLHHSLYLALLDATYRRRLRRKKRGAAESSESYTAQLMEVGGDLKERHASRAEYEQRRMEFQEQKSKRDQEKWELEKKREGSNTISEQP
ncbi:unnamed protein product [Linum trigynum]|uniref:Uncharacterized protein n=1 Tax=Linum trigynum TaxID=586398 RepID=A0AAV2E4B5_9ROSI